MLFNTLPVLLKDGYKVGHKFQYEPDTTLIYSNLTARSTRVPGDTGILAWGFQYFCREYLQRQFERHFFGAPLDRVMAAYKRRIDGYLGALRSYDHIADLWKLRHLPLHIKAVPEGTFVPLRVPFLTIRNTRPEFYWLTNMVETLMSNVLWMPITSATTALAYRRRFEYWARRSGGNLPMVKWQGHDFSMRGMAGIEASMLSGAAHLLCFNGTDTIPAIDFLEHYYYADNGRGAVAGSVPATEHSVMSMGRQDAELQTIRRLITEVYPRGIVSIVCDTWDFWKVITEYTQQLRAEILGRDGKVVVRPDSGDPVKILCGDPSSEIPHVRAGAVETLWKQFPGPTTTSGYRTLDPHVGLIYGDSITRQRQEEILSRLWAKGFVTTDCVLGVGSFTYQYVTRDTYGIAMKATYGETRSRGPQPIWKAPKTDDGTKHSATGLLRVDRSPSGSLVLRENVSWDEEAGGVLESVFVDGVEKRTERLNPMRARVDALVEAELAQEVA